MEDQKFLDFLAALGECFAEHICPPVDPEDALPQECIEAVCGWFGTDLTPRMLAEIRIDDQLDLADSLGNHFDCDSHDLFEPIANAIDALLKRWPKGSLGEYLG